MAITSESRLLRYIAFNGFNNTWLWLDAMDLYALIFERHTHKNEWRIYDVNIVKYLFKMPLLGEQYAEMMLDQYILASKEPLKSVISATAL